MADNSHPSNSPANPSTAPGGSVQTTGHAWDGDLREYNNPLPRWWLWTFYGTVVFAVLYWLFNPAWPLGDSFTKGPLRELFGLGQITYEAEGETQTTHWNTRAKLIQELNQSPAAVAQREYLEQVADASYQAIFASAEMMAFARSMGQGLFGDNCAPCHGSGGQGVASLYPSLVDDAWLWGGSVSAIETSIAAGRRGFMPAFAETFDAQQLAAVIEYVLSLSYDTGLDARLVREGAKIFKGETGGCYYCHKKSGTGLRSQGAANLTDAIWTVARVGQAERLEGKREALAEVIVHGIQRNMPAWSGRLSDTEIKLLTAYVHELGGGQ